jgi:O-antigen ligase
LLWPLLGLIFFSALSLIVNPLLKPFWFQFGFMRWVILLWMFIWVFEEVWSQGFEDKLLKVWTAAIVITAIYSVFQFFAGIDLFRSQVRLDTLDNGFFRATGFFSMSLTFAYVIGVSYFAVITAAYAKWGRSFWFVTVASAGLIALVASGSRGAWIGAFLAGLVYFVGRHPRLLPYFAGLTAAALVVLSFISSKFATLMHLHTEHSSNVRLHLWRAYLEIFKDHPFFGAGLFQVDRILPEYYQRLGINEKFTSHAHNVPLQWAAGAGIFALGFYVFISFWFLRLSWRLTKTSAWGWGLLMAQIYWHVGGMTEANFFDAEVNHAIVFTWALMVYLGSKAHLKSDSSRISAASWATSDRHRKGPSPHESDRALRPNEL